MSGTVETTAGWRVRVRIVDLGLAVLAFSLGFGAADACARLIPLAPASGSLPAGLGLGWFLGISWLGLLIEAEDRLRGGRGGPLPTGVMFWHWHGWFALAACVLTLSTLGGLFPAGFALVGLVLMAGLGLVGVTGFVSMICPGRTLLGRRRVGSPAWDALGHAIVIGNWWLLAPAL